jgi:hypothetical protein
MKKVFRVLGVLVLSSLVITSSFGAVRNLTPVDEGGGSSGSCPPYIGDQSYDCFLVGYVTHEDGSVTCNYSCQPRE